MRSRSDAVSGFASLSARAAASMASGGIALTVLPEIIVLLILQCPPCRNDPDALLTLRVCHEQHENVARREADDYESLLAIIFTIIHPVNSEWIAENRTCQLEAHAMVSQVGLGFNLVPFELQIS